MIENMNKVYLISTGTHVPNACNNFPEFCTIPRIKTRHRWLCTLAWNGNDFAYLTAQHTWHCSSVGFINSPGEFIEPITLARFKFL